MYKCMCTCMVKLIGTMDRYTPQCISHFDHFSTSVVHPLSFSLEEKNHSSHNFFFPCNEISLCFCTFESVGWKYGDCGENDSSK
jgi:hypothetical protein